MKVAKKEIDNLIIFSEKEDKHISADLKQERMLEWLKLDL